MTTVNIFTEKWKWPKWKSQNESISCSIPQIWHSCFSIQVSSESSTQGTKYIYKTQWFVWYQPWTIQLKKGFCHGRWVPWIVTPRWGQYAGRSLAILQLKLLNLRGVVVIRWPVLGGNQTIPRWWFQTLFIFTPTWGNDPIWLNLTNIFQMGWNHQSETNIWVFP